MIELLVTVSIMSISFVAILSAIGVFMSTSTVHRSLADLDVATRTYVEQLSNAPYDGVCPADYSSVPVPAKFTATISPKYWNGVPSPAAFGTCAAGATDNGAQQLTVTVNHATSQQTPSDGDTLTIVKRRT